MVNTFVLTTISSWCQNYKQQLVAAIQDYLWSFHYKYIFEKVVVTDKKEFIFFSSKKFALSMFFWSLFFIPISLSFIVTQYFCFPLCKN